MSWERQNTLTDTLINQGLKLAEPFITAIVYTKLGPKIPPGMPNGGGMMGVHRELKIVAMFFWLECHPTTVVQYIILAHFRSGCPLSYSRLSR